MSNGAQKLDDEHSLTEAEWYVGKADKSGIWYGPYSHDEVLQRLRDGKISWADGIWTKDLGPHWQRILDLGVFRAHFPALPPQTLIPALGGQRSTASALPAIGDEAAVESTTAIGGGTKTNTRTQVGTMRNEPVAAGWYVNFAGSEFGPLSATEVESVLRRGKLSGKLLGWREGFETWKPFHQIPEFQSIMTGGLPPNRLEKRKNGRRELIATVRFSRLKEDGQRSSNTYTGIAQDISPTGILVNTSQVPRSIGMMLWLEVQPVDTEALPDFTAKCKVTRIAGDKGFAAQFLDLEPSVREAIEAFTIL